MRQCDRCGQSTNITIMSMFNTETICIACKDRERAHPRYAEARDRDHDAVVAGIRNFPGIGLPADLVVVQAARTGA